MTVDVVHTVRINGMFLMVSFPRDDQTSHSFKGCNENSTLPSKSCKRRRKVSGCGLGLISRSLSLDSITLSLHLLLPRRDAFIYEYIGDVVSQPSFVKRMRDYADEGIRHFYFMMLQKDEVRFPTSSLHFPCLTSIRPYEVHRCNEAWRNWSIRQPQL